MLCDVAEEIKDITANDLINQEDKIGTTPEKGRVWRWSNTSSGLRKNTEGPVLRPTVKPVRRFIPELNSTASSSNNPQNQTPISQKQITAVNNDDNPSSEQKSKRQSSNSTTANQSYQSNNNKKKRVREQWSIEDKNHFFDAVAVHGKDFDAIQKAIAQKHKKRGDESVVKTKDQVRHLFYRTWTTINKLLNHEAPASHNVKGSHELLAVINYGELRKKLGGCILKKKGILKLNELISYGSTSVRVKGKNYRIKTPSCKALKRIHDLEGAAKKSSVIETRRIKLPLRINLELHPLSMSAWNHVHLLAHNPRLRFNIPLDCQLSYLLSYLNKKWQSLSTKMFHIAQAEASNAAATKDAGSPSSNKIEIHIPPELAVKAKYQVHEIVNTKTHCIVTYVVHKSGKQLPKKKKKEIEASDAHLTVTVELCNSSEDEAGFVDHTSDVEEHPAAHSVTPTDELQETAEDFKYEDLKRVGEADSDEGGTTENILAKIVQDKDILSPEADPEKFVNSFFQETEISAEQIEICAPTADTVDSSESVSSNINMAVKISPDKELKEMSEKLISQEELHEKCSSGTATINCISPDTIENAIPPPCFEPLSQHMDGQDSCSNRETLASPSFPTETPQMAEVASADDVAETENEHVSCEVATEVDSPIKPVPVISIQKVWDSDTVGDITLAEIYLMLGKPGLFKLCYEWKEIERSDNCSSQTDTSSSQKLSTSITALVQYASLLLSKVQKYESHSSVSKDHDRNTDAKCNQHSGVSVGIQCSLLDKNDSATTRKSISPFSNVTKKSQNKGLKRSLDNEKSSDDFVIPNIPPRRKRNQSTFAHKTFSSVEGIPQGGQVRLSDVEFRKQMDALNRRIDLFRTKNRNRGSRKPYIVQRAMMPNARSVRKMMTLSIDSLGANRVGFFPVTNQTLDNAEPELEAVGATISSSKVSEKSWNSDGNNVNDALGRMLPTTSSSSQPSVLAQAAEEAGLFQHDSNSETSTNLNSGAALDNSKTTQSSTSRQSESFTYPHNSIMDSPVESAASSSLDTERQSMIRNDVTLPIRPPTPSVDSLSSLFDFNTPSNNLLSTFCMSAQETDDSGRNTPVLSMPVLDLLNTPRKSMPSPVHPWNINCNSRDGLSGFATLNTPQRILPSDSEDSVDSLIFSLTKRSRVVGAADNLTSDDAESNLQMQCMMNDDSVDFIAKFRNSTDVAADSSCNTAAAVDTAYEQNEHS